MADIGEDRFGHPEDEEQRPRKFQVIDKRFQAEEEEAAAEASAAAAAAAPAPSPEPPPAAASAPEPVREARTIKIDVPPAAGSEASNGASGADDDDADAAAAAALASGLNPDPLAISNAMLFFIEELFSRVLIFLGLTPNPQTGLTVQNLEQAQKGIQLIELLIGEIRKEVKSPEIDQNLLRMVAQLKAAYVQIVTTGGLSAGMGAPPGGR